MGDRNHSSVVVESECHSDSVLLQRPVTVFWDNDAVSLAGEDEGLEKGSRERRAAVGGQAVRYVRMLEVYVDETPAWRLSSVPPV